MSKLKHRPLFIKIFFLILSHSENFLIVKGFKARRKLIICGTLIAFKFPCFYPKRYAITVNSVSVSPIFFSKQFAVLVKKAYAPFKRYLCSNFTIGNSVINSLLMISAVFIRHIPRISHIYSFLAEARFTIFYRLT